MSEMEAKAHAVQNILSGAIEATAGLADSQRRYGGSCTSLTSEAASFAEGGSRRSRIPLPRSMSRDACSPLPSLSGRSTPAMRRENSLAQIHYASKKKTPPKVPPKPSHLGPVQKRQLRKESSLPPQPPNMSLRREASFDSVASGSTLGAGGGGPASSVRSFRSVSANMSRIPVSNMSTSCSNLKELNYVESKSMIPGPTTTAAQKQAQFRYQRTLSSSSNFTTKSSTAAARNKSSHLQYHNSQRSGGLHGQLRAAQSVDHLHHRAQLEEKDKAIEALKQAAKERDWKLEKLQLNLQTFKSVGSLKDMTVFSPSAADLTSLEPDQQSSMTPVCDYATYMRMLSENADLQRTNGLLKLESGKSGLGEAEKVEALQTEVKILSGNNKDLEAMLDGRDVDLTLAEEKRQLQHLNVGLAEKVAVMREAEATVVAKMQDFRDQAELLEFRVLELEEERDKLKDEMASKSLSLSIVTDDSGCNSSVSTEGAADILELYQDFRKEKVADTKAKLQAMVTSTPGAGDKSLLLQTVALFETLLAKIHDLQGQNEKIRSRLEEEGRYDALVLELESARKDIQIAECKIDESKKTASEHEAKEETSSRMLEMQAKVESDLKRQVADLNERLSSAMVGRQSESEMYEEAVLKASRMENAVTELEARCDAMAMENVDLKEHLNNALEHQTSKSVGSLESELSSSSSHPKESSSSVTSSDHHKNSSSSGVSSDLSDSDNEPATMDESGIFIEKDPSSEKTHTDKPKLPKKEKRHSTSSSSTQTSEENTGNGMETMTTETAGNSNLELDDCSAELREACGGLVMRKKETEAEIEGCKEQIRSLMSSAETSDGRICELERVEFSLRNQLREWEDKYMSLRRQNMSAVEKSCELEEAENDSRLSAQRWERQFRMEFEKNDCLENEIAAVRTQCTMIQDELAEARDKEGEMRSDAAYMDSLVQRYEQRLFELEEIEVELREKLALLEQACNVVSWVRMVEREGRINLKTLPMVTEYLEQGTQTAQEGEALDEGYQGQGQGQDQGQEGAVIREELMELRERESAYKETIREADTILSMVEGGYVQKIGTLESELTALRSKVESAEKSEIKLAEELKALKSNNRGSTDANFKIAELLERLMETEKSERALKEQVYAMEKGEFGEKDALLQRLSRSELECNKLSEEVARLGDAERRYQDAMQQQQKLRERVDDLEVEGADSAASESLLSEKKESEAKCKKLENELQAERDTTAEREAEETRRRNVLRIEVEGAKAAAKRAHDDLQREKADRAALADSSEAAFKSEVSVPLGSMREESPKTVPGEQKAQPEVKIPGERATSEVKMASKVKMASEVTAEDAEDDGSGWRQRMAARTLQSGNSFTLARYRSVRDHNGRYYLVVKVR